MARLNTTLYLETAYMDILKKRGISISKAVNAYLSFLAKMPPEMDVQIAILKSIQMSLETILQQHTDIVVHLQERISILSTEITDREILMRDTRKATRVAEILREISNTIRTQNYDIEKVAPIVEPFLRELNLFGLKADMAWLERQRELLKLIE